MKTFKQCSSLTICRYVTLAWIAILLVFLTGTVNAQSGEQSVNQSGAQSGKPPTSDTTPATSKIFRSHAITLYDEPAKYGPEFRHFDYVNPTAPKGGRMTTGAQGTFNSFHQFIPKGDSIGTMAVETLLTKSLDEPFTNYGLIASEIEWPLDRSWVVFHINPQARWHDGKAVTADDVVWSFNTLTTKGPPNYQFYFSSVDKAEKLTDMSVRFSFKEGNNRELPMIMGDLPVLPKHYWESRDFEQISLDPPLGSGPYRVKKFEAGRYVVYERVEDYWAKDHPTQIGQNNLAELETRFYLDPGAMRIAVRAGDLDYRLENQAKAWAVDYQVDAVEKGWLRKDVFPTSQTQGMIGLVMNLRRELFKDIRVRKALILAYDYEWTNKNMFFGQYTRFESYFDNSPMKAINQPVDEELELLEPYRDQLSSDVFESPAPNPSTDASGWPRDNLLEAARLLDEAGWVVRDLKRVNALNGMPFRFEIMNVSPSFERLFLPYIRNLKRLGIEANIRTIDTSQFIERRRNFDFDTFYSGWGQSASPGNEQREMWTTASAERPASRNYLGLADPVVDALVEKIIQAPTRESLNARTRALDRVLRAGHYVIPGWFLPADRVLYWDKFDYPPATKYGATTATWWFDESKARALEMARKSDDSISQSTDGVSATSSDRPGRWTTIAWILAALVVLWWLIRRAMNSPAREKS